MARRRTRIPLNVLLNGRLVGRLNRAASGAIDFRYDPDWLSWEHALPVSLSLRLREDRYTGDPVIAVFDNLLPDSEPIRRRLAERVQAEGYDAYSLLAKVGRDCVGALQFLPDGVDPGSVGTVDGRPAPEEYVATNLADLTATPLGVDDDEEFRMRRMPVTPALQHVVARDCGVLPDFPSRVATACPTTRGTNNAVLLSLHDGTAEFELIDRPQAADMPAVRWKLVNIEKLMSVPAVDVLASHIPIGEARSPASR